MLQLTTTDDGGLELTQRLTPPAIYCDHWAWIEIAADADYSRRLSDAIKAKNGSFCLSWVNLAEYVGVGHVSRRIAAEEFLNSLFPNVTCVSPVFLDVMRDEEQVRKTAGQSCFLDMGLAKAFLANGSKQVRLYSADHMLQWMDPERLQGRLRRLKRRIWVEVERIRRNAHLGRKIPLEDGTNTARLFRGLMDLTIKNGWSFKCNDTMDFLHAVVPCSYCDVVLLDGPWTKRVEETTSGLLRGNQPKGTFAKVISSKGSWKADLLTAVNTFA